MKHTKETRKLNTTMKKQHWNTVMTYSFEKQQSYYNEKAMKHKNEESTIVQQSYNIRTAKKNNEKRKWNTAMKNNKETQQWHSAMKNNNRTTMKPTIKQKNKKQQFYNNHTTIVQQ